MRTSTLFICFAAVVATALAQVPTGPVVNPRGVINAFTQQPAPSIVAAGGIIWINGLNLGPAEGIAATGSPLPTKLGEPPVEVLINGRNAPVFSANPARVVAQVPYEVQNGYANVVVRRGNAQSRPARIQVINAQPSVRTVDDKGFGEAMGKLSGSTLTVTAMGLGDSDPNIATGEAGAADGAQVPHDPVRAFVGGLPANTTASASPTRVGEFDVGIEVPAQAQPGDTIVVLSANRAANRVTYRKATAADVKYVKLPDGTPDLHSLVSSDLRGDFLIASGARDDQGCYPSYLVEARAGAITPVDGCLTAVNRNAQSPSVTAVDNNTIAALAGPPQGDQQTGVSSTVEIFSAGAAPITVTLPAPAMTLGSGAGGDFNAILAGTPPKAVTIDSTTGEVTERQVGGGQAGGGQPAGQGGVPGLTGDLDLGGGVKHVLSAPIAMAQGIAVVVGDDEDHPKIAKLAVLNARGELQTTRDFPDNWAPVVAPNQPAPAGGGGQGGGVPGVPAGGAVGALLRPRLAYNFDAQTRTLYILSRKTDDSVHGLVSFATDVKALHFPDKWFATACTPNLPVFSLELSRRLAFLISNAVDLEFKNPCPAHGFAVLDLGTQNLSAVALPGQGQFNAAQGSYGDMNDYLYGVNTDPARRGTSDTMYVLDGVTLSAFRLDAPAGIVNFAQPRPLPALGMVQAIAVGRAAGDGGIILFDLDNADRRVLPTPEGFANVTVLDVSNTTRKLVARGIKPNNGGSQILIYDLLNGDLIIVPNPPGCAFAGDAPPPTPPVPGQPAAARIPDLLAGNPKANTAQAVCYSADRKQAGILVVRIP